MPVPTHGLTHIGLAVKDPERAARFYAEVFGCKAYYRDAEQVQVLDPGHGVLAFERDPERAGQMAGVTHFGFRLKEAKDIEAAVRAVEQAGGKVTERGEFAPGVPYCYARDPDGYAIEIWWEP
jgi:catechol 2,3-dioxygenase-like lactoylglutathione lyase family enzyme